jgi:hypothetical protein
LKEEGDELLELVRVLAKELEQRDQH